MLAATTEITTDPSAVSVVLLVMMAGCAFGIALGFPVNFLIAACALIGLATGYYLSVVSGLVLVTILKVWAPALLPVLGRINLDRFQKSRPRETKHAGTARQRTGPKQQSGDPGDFETFFGSGATGKNRQRRPSPPPVKPATQSAEKILGLPSTFGRKELEAARRRMAKQFHPDLHRRASASTQKQMARRMREVNAAYETLKSQVA